VRKFEQAGNVCTSVELLDLTRAFIHVEIELNLCLNGNDAPETSLNVPRAGFVPATKGDVTPTPIFLSRKDWLAFAMPT
jgi:hypothetical protein